MSLNQKTNTKIITEAELLGVYDTSSLILQTKLFLGAQGYKVEKCIFTKIIKSLS